MSSLRSNILATVCYYDVLNYPLTSFEVWRHMICADVALAEDTVEKISHDNEHLAYTLHAVESALQALVGDGQLMICNGFYTLPGHRQLVRERSAAARISLYKLRRLRRIVWLLRFVPFVRGVFVTGRLAMKSADAGSDLDVLVVLRSGHIWTGRFLVTLVTQVLGVRRTDEENSDRVCLNYFVTDASLRVPTQDLFAAHEYSFIFPLFGKEVFKQFQRDNEWIKKFKPHYSVSKATHYHCLSDSFVTKLKRLLGEFILGASFIENKMRVWQEKKINTNEKTRLPGALIIATDEHLVFLPKPHGPVVLEKFKQLVADRL